MTTPRDLRDDDALLAVVGRSLDHDPSTDVPAELQVPTDAVAVARAAFELRDLDDELAALVHDSLVDESPVVRHDATASRILSYATSRLSLDVELEPDGRTVIGVVAPAGAASVEIESAGAVERTTTDDLGRFRAELAPGWCRFRVRASGATLLTPLIVR